MTYRPSLAAVTCVGVAAVFLAFVFVLDLAGDRQFWADDGASVAIATSDTRTFVQLVTGQEQNQAPFYVVLRAWQSVSVDETWLRLLAGVFMAAAIGLVGWIGTRFYGLQTGIAAMVILGGHHLIVDFALQVRGYSLYLFLTSLTILLFIRMIDRPSRATAVTWGIAAAVTIMAQNFGVFLLATQAVWIFLHRRHYLLDFRLAPAAIPILLVVGMTGIAAIGPARDNILWAEDLSLTLVREVVFSFANYSRAPSEYTRIYFGSHLLWAALISIPAVAVVRHGLAQQPTGDAQARFDRNDLTRFLIYFFLVSALGPMIVSLVKPVFVTRFLLATLIPASLLAAIGITAFGRIAITIVLPVLLALPLILAFDELSSSVENEDWRTVTEDIAAEISPDDVLTMYSPVGLPPFDYYVDKLELRSQFPEHTPYHGKLDTQLESLWDLPEGYHTGGLMPDGDPDFLVEQALQGSGVLWLLLTHTQAATLDSPRQRTQLVEALSARANNQTYFDWDGVEAYRFQF